MRAEGGIFWLDLQNPLKEPVTDCGDSAKKEKCPPGNETVLFVDRHGNAWLVSLALASISSSWFLRYILTHWPCGDEVLVAPSMRGWNYETRDRCDLY